MRACTRVILRCHEAGIPLSGSPERPVPLLAVPIDLPPDVVELRSGDVDADGQDELIAVSHKDQGSAPKAVTVTVFHLDQQGSVERQWSANLKNTPLVLDVEAGLWAQGPKGIMQVTEDGIRLAAEARTALSGLGRTTPIFADVFVDIEGDGVPETILSNGRSLRLLSTDGTERGQIPIRGQGELSTRVMGGIKVVAASVSPSWWVDDFNGDGSGDVLVSEGKTLTVYPVTAEGLQPKQTVMLPVDVSPKDRDWTGKKGETKKRAISVWLEDLDGDGLTDFTAQLWVTKGSWMGSEGELVFAKGTGSGFGAPQRMVSENAVVMVRLIDLDGDGDKELAAAEIDFGVGNLTRALVSQKIRVDLVYRMMTDGRYGDVQDLHSVVVPVGSRNRDAADELNSDLTGDGVPDLVTTEGGETIQILKGTGTGFEGKPMATLEVGFDQGEDKLWVGDLTGDGRAEIVVWRPEGRSAKVLQLQ